MGSGGLTTILDLHLAASTRHFHLRPSTPSPPVARHPSPASLKTSWGFWGDRFRNALRSHAFGKHHAKQIGARAERLISMGWQPNYAQLPPNATLVRIQNQEDEVYRQLETKNKGSAKSGKSGRSNDRVHGRGDNEGGDTDRKGGGGGGGDEAGAPGAGAGCSIGWSSADPVCGIQQARHAWGSADSRGELRRWDAWAHTHRCLSVLLAFSDTLGCTARLTKYDFDLADTTSLANWFKIERVDGTTTSTNRKVLLKFY